MCLELCAGRVMRKPPREIDGAKVLEWAWSDGKPFGVVLYESGEIASEIFGLAICSYNDNEKIYRFSCDSGWEVEQDSDYCTINEVKSHLPEQYQDTKAHWKTYE